LDFCATGEMQQSWRTLADSIRVLRKTDGSEKFSLSPVVGMHKSMKADCGILRGIPVTTPNRLPRRRGDTYELLSPFRGRFAATRPHMDGLPDCVCRLAFASRRL
jgi:hypothetical protein